MDLFSAARETQRKKEAPLATRMRPERFEDFIGQQEIVGPNRLLRRAIEADRITSMIFYGPPGTGKTTLAFLIAKYTKAHFETVNAVSTGVTELRKLIKEAEERYALHGKRTIVFIDEIHRFNKGQQDALLPAVEDGTIILLGATTENPYYEVNTPLLSRSRIFRLRPLTDDEMKQVIARALQDREKGLGDLQVELEPAALEHLVRVAEGDARLALNGLELAALTTEPGPDGKRVLTAEIIADSVQQKVIRYDKQGDNHYDTISAFIKSIRGSDPDAALFYLARMLKAGEDPKFIARRMIILAAEDIGNADPQGLLVAVAAAQAVEMVGLPEARIPMAQAAVYLATAPKSNACYLGIDRASADVDTVSQGTIPLHLRDASHPGSRQMGHGQGYLYPHAFPGHYVRQEYLPPELKGRRYYEPTTEGYEREIKARIEKWRTGGE
ncbi:MAG TPA: replication-associated recombination protein A [Firmicutes bacterium]|uniref:Replication-associated recombination protein A n=1 Tax=Capillibacterium thermochitinicola TaxID=2699427 RepID=A0A8J6HZ25_9FIRM|nr:replication-associated recombination protein A [Capillibacterium thermochitinicola]MBA2131993.1 replication-associated recombination protein A [Capillibacterium thermochitinicola]HHW12543.1 replication-associated recombination protein A [Bacillota bacterium]